MKEITTIATFLLKNSELRNEVFEFGSILTLGINLLLVLIV